MKELSIIAVVIDNLEITKRFISSIRQYTKGNYELILIDNGSEDLEAVDFYKKSSDVYYRFESIVDLAKAWNKGIKLSKGKLVAVVNNDTVVGPRWFDILKQNFRKNKKLGLVHPITLWLIQGYYKYNNLKKFDTTFSKPFKLERFKDIVWGEFMVFNKKALNDVGGFNEIYKRAGSEDLEIVFQLFSKGYDIVVDPRVFVYHQGHASFENEKIIKQKDVDPLGNKNFQLFKSRWSKYTKGW